MSQNILRLKLKLTNMKSQYKSNGYQTQAQNFQEQVNQMIQTNKYQEKPQQ